MGNRVSAIKHVLVIGLPKSGKSAIIAALTDGCSNTYIPTVGFDERLVQPDISMVELGGSIVKRWLPLLQGPLNYQYTCIILCVDNSWPLPLIEYSRSILLRLLCALRGTDTLRHASLLVLVQQKNNNTVVQKRLQLQLLRSNVILNGRVAVVNIHPVNRPLHTALSPILKWITNNSNNA